MADATYDAAYAIETIYFWPDLVAGLREMLRVLKPGGFAAVAVECADPVASQRWVDLVGRMEVRSPEQIAEALREAGFAEVEVFGEHTGRSALCGLHCIVGRKADACPVSAPLAPAPDVPYNLLHEHHPPPPRGGDRR